MSERRVGIEVEFSGIDIDTAVNTIATELNARVETVSDNEYLLHAADHTDPFRVEVDFELLKTLSRDERNAPDQIRQTVVGFLEAAAAIATPLELVTPPIKFSALPDIDRLINVLADRGAVGTQDSLAYAFGVHFNPNVVSDDPEEVLRHIRAFICLYEWLIFSDRMDMTRKITSFANPFPKDYELLVLPGDYRPDRRALVRDYLVHNPTRNRALDMLPLFSAWEDEVVRETIEDERIKSRPTYHYRLPNSRIGDEDWSIRKPWQDWLMVEKLAANERELAKLASERLNHVNRWSFSGGAELWIAECQKTLKNLASA